MTSRVCVDASLVLRWLLPTDQDVLADSLLRSWDSVGTEIVSAPLLDTEVTSTIRRYSRSGKILREQSARAYRLYLAIGITILNPSELSQKSWDLAVEYDQIWTQDMQYIAAAEIAKCELWTADRRLASLVHDKRGWVRWLGEHMPDAHDSSRTSRHDIDPRRYATPTLDDPGLWRRI